MMRFVLLSLLWLPQGILGFLAPGASVGSRRVRLNLSAAEDEVAALRAAAAKARADADRLSKELGKNVAGLTATTSKSNKLSKEELQSRLAGVATPNEEIQMLSEQGSLALFKSANLRTYPVSLSMLESRTGISLESFGFGNASGEKVSLDDFKYSTLYVVAGATVAGVGSLALLPPNIGATLCYLFALIPIIYLGIGSVAPAAIAQVIDGIKNRDDPDRATSDGDRVARHEAAHFLCGYACGLNIVDYKLLESGVPCVEFVAGAGQRYSKEDVSALSVTSMSGLVAEAMQFGDVRGAQNDLLELQQIFRKSEDFIGAQQQQDLTRWGALQAFLILKQNQGKFNEVVEAFKNQKDVAECVAILES